MLVSCLFLENIIDLDCKLEGVGAMSSWPHLLPWSFTPPSWDGEEREEVTAQVPQILTIIITEI